MPASIYSLLWTAQKALSSGARAENGDPGQSGGCIPPSNVISRVPGSYPTGWGECSQRQGRAATPRGGLSALALNPLHALPVEASPAQHPPAWTRPKLILAIAAITLDALKIRIAVVSAAVAIVVLPFRGHELGEGSPTRGDYRASLPLCWWAIWPRRAAVDDFSQREIHMHAGGK